MVAPRGAGAVRVGPQGEGCPLALPGAGEAEAGASLRRGGGAAPFSAASFLAGQWSILRFWQVRGGGQSPVPFVDLLRRRVALAGWVWCWGW